MSTSLATSPDRADTDSATPAKGLGLGRLDLAVAGVLALVMLAVYLRTIAPGLLVDDSGEFQTMARLLGHTHPTGYETYSIMGRVFSFVPVGDFATRVTALSGFMGAVSVALVYLIIRVLDVPRVIAVVPALAIAVSPTFWSQSIIAEVYTPAAVLALVVLGSLIAWERSGSGGFLVAAGIAGGMALGVHFTIGLLVPAVAVFLIILAFERGWVATLKPAAIGAVAGVAVAVGSFAFIDVIDPPAQYFDAVIAPSHSAWDLEPGEIDGLGTRLVFDWTARQFSSLMFTNPGLMDQRIAGFRQTLSTEIATPLLAAAVLGLIFLLWRRWKVALLLTAALVTYLVFAFNYDIGGQIYVFYIPAYLIIALLAGAGLGGVSTTLSKVPRVQEAWLAPLVAVGPLLFAVYPIVQPNIEHIREGTTPPYEFEAYPYDDYVGAILHDVLTATVADLPQDAIVFTGWDMLYPYYWVAHVEQGRTDLVFHETYPADDQEGIADSLVDYIRAQSRERPVYVGERIQELTDAGLAYSPSRIGPTKMLKVRER